MEPNCSPNTGDDVCLIARRLPDDKKKEILAAMSEDDFRDRVVRPLYRRLKFKHLRDTCGPDELGKDCIFTSVDAFGAPIAIAVQTKTGRITMGANDPGRNLLMIEAQLRTALDAPIILDDNATQIKPIQAHLCASGPISNQAREHLVKKLESHRIKILGSDQVIELVDQLYPEFWLGVQADRFPYARELRRRLCLASDVVRMSELTGNKEDACPALDGNYLKLRLNRMEEKTVTINRSIIVDGRTVGSRPEKHVEPRFVDIPVEELLRKRDRLVLVTADGGSGKTTALRRLAITLADQILAGSVTCALPVLVRADDVAKTAEQKLIDLIASQTASMADGKPPIAADDFERGRVAVFVDALDEAASHDRETVLDRISEFHALYPDCLIVLTSRDYRSILELSRLGRFTHYRILPIQLKEAEGLIERAIKEKHFDPQAVRSTLRKLNEVHGMTLSPMLITIYLSSSDFSKQDLPPNIAEIFKKFTEQMIGRWDQQKGLSQQYEAPTKDFLLRQLGFQMHAKRVRSFLVQDVRAIFTTALAKRDLQIDAEIVFEEIVNRSGLLRSDGITVEWRHHLLQEYFAGRGIPSPQFLSDVVSDEWWRTPLVFYFGDKAEDDATLTALCEKADLLPPGSTFDAAITLGLSVQACYLAETGHKIRILEWVLSAFARSMDEFRKSVGEAIQGDSGLVSLCTMLAMGRDAIGTRTLAKIAIPNTNASVPSGEGLFTPVDPERVEAWRIVGLMEAGEIDLAYSAMEAFRTKSRELIFMIFLSVGWALYSEVMEPETRKNLDRYLQNNSEVVVDLSEKLMREFRSLLFEIRSGKLTPLPEPADIPPIGA